MQVSGKRRHISPRNPKPAGLCTDREAGRSAKFRQKDVIYMETNESRIRYLEAIQRVIDRLSNTSFILKGWAVSMVAGLMALAASGTNHGYVLVAYIPTVVFWLLDAYFLMMERQYRKLFEENMDLSLEVICFTLKRKKANFSMFAEAALSITMLLTYGPLIGAVLIAMFVLGG